MQRAVVLLLVAMVGLHALRAASAAEFQRCPGASCTGALARYYDLVGDDRLVRDVEFVSYDGGAVDGLGGVAVTTTAIDRAQARALARRLARGLHRAHVGRLGRVQVLVTPQTLSTTRRRTSWTRPEAPLASSRGGGGQAVGACPGPCPRPIAAVRSAWARRSATTAPAVVLGRVAWDRETSAGPRSVVAADVSGLPSADQVDKDTTLLGQVAMRCGLTAYGAVRLVVRYRAEQDFDFGFRILGDRLVAAGSEALGNGA